MKKTPTKTPNNRSQRTPNTPQGRRRYSAARVRLTRINIDELDNDEQQSARQHRTRNALVAEFQERNIMTRKRQSVEQIKSPAQRVGHSKKIASNATSSASSNQSSSSASTSTVSSRKSSLSSPTTRSPARSSHSTPKQLPTKTQQQQRKSAPQPAQETTKPNSLKRSRPDRNQSTKENEKTPLSKSITPRTRKFNDSSTTSSPSVTPVPKRRSVRNVSPVATRKSRSEDTTKNKTVENRTTAAAKATTVNANARQISKIPTKLASNSSTAASQTNERASRSMQSTTNKKSMLPLRKSNRSTSNVTRRRK